MDYELASVIVLSISLIGVILAYDRSLRELKRLKNERQNNEYRARQMAAKLVGEARQKALEIMTAAHLDTDKAQKLLDEKLDELMKDQIVEYKEELQKVSDNIASEIRKESDEFGKVLEMETIGMQKAVASKLENDYQKVEEEIEHYKEDRIKNIEQNIGKILEEAARKQLGRAISIDTNIDLIIEALEEAKNRHAI